jgi:hypothetical protein
LKLRLGVVSFDRRSCCHSVFGRIGTSLRVGLWKDR